MPSIIANFCMSCLLCLIFSNPQGLSRNLVRLHVLYRDMKLLASDGTASRGQSRDQTLIDPNPEPTTPAPLHVPLFLSQGSLEEKAGVQARGQQPVNRRWLVKAEQHLGFFLFIGSSFQKEADAIATSQTAFHKLGSERQSPGQPAGPTPGSHQQSRGFNATAFSENPSSPRQYLPSPSLPGPGSKMGTSSTTGCLLCKHEGIDGWNLKWLSFHPGV